MKYHSLITIDFFVTVSRTDCLLVELALAERDSKNAGVSFFLSFFFVGGT